MYYVEGVWYLIQHSLAYSYFCYGGKSIWMSTPLLNIPIGERMKQNTRREKI